MAASSPLSIYPEQLAAAVRQVWFARGLPPELLPAELQLAQLLDLMYQASLMQEEGRSVQLRIVVADPKTFDEYLGDGTHPLHALQFAETIPATVSNLRRLSAAANVYRTLLGVQIDRDGHLQIWGIINTGTSWIQAIEAARNDPLQLPPNLVTRVIAPGQIMVSSGYDRLLELSRGVIRTDGFDPFRSRWLPRRFFSVRESLLTELHSLIAARGGEGGLLTGDSSVSDARGEYSYDLTSRLHDSFVKDVVQSVVRQMLRLVRNRGHGGTLIYLHDAAVGQWDGLPPLSPWLRFRVRFASTESAFRMQRLVVRLVLRCLEAAENRQWSDIQYRRIGELMEPAVREIDGSLRELAHLMADLMSIDGALVLTRGFQLIGFGAEILGDTHVDRIHRALDVEGVHTIEETVEDAGTRHRSVYRLIAALPDTIAIVVSQDGEVRFVAHHGGRLVYWPYSP